MAQQTRQPVILVCTSGSAAYNFAPAIAEAYFQEIPILVLTADRPKEWVDQLDGQTIRQHEIYGSHVKQFFELPQDHSHRDSSWHANRIVNEAINLATSEPRGPVHINAPFREPLYPKTNDILTPVVSPRNIQAFPEQHSLSEPHWTEILKGLSHHKKILLVPGQQVPSEGLIASLRKIHQNNHLPLVGDILSNFHFLPFYCRHSDAFLGQLPATSKEFLEPDLLITFGKSLVAKNLKLFLRSHPPKEHWHIQPTPVTPDTFQALTRIIPVSPEYFFTQVSERFTSQPNTQQKFAEAWQRYESKTQALISDFFDKQDLGEFAFVKKVLAALPTSCNLHLANSMSVRYANHIGLLSQQKGVTVFSNRGTSGIDGCSSTAVGQALTSTVPNILITGDQAFFYDRNAFWHNYPLANLFVIVINNHGGIIFNLIDGPAGLPEAEEFFITRQTLRAQALANEFGFSYTEGGGVKLQDFFKADGNAKILELETPQSTNKEIFESFRKHIKEHYEAE